jgi:RNA polymerase sigma-70 factor, ECF subfamily
MHAYQDMVYSTAMRLTADAAQAEDIAQEVFLRAYQHFERIQGSATVGGWLKTVATNLTLNHLSRHRRRWRLFSELAPEAPDPEELVGAIDALDSLPAEMDAEQRATLVRDALTELPEHQRVPLVLFHFHDMAYEQIAAQLGVSLAKIKTDILRGRLALAKRLARHGLATERAGR